MVSEELLEMLVCPKCKTKLHLNSHLNCLICKRCNLQFEIKNGVPDMVIDGEVKLSLGDER